MNAQTWFQQLLQHHAESNSVETLVRFSFFVTCWGATSVLWWLSPIETREKKAAVAAGIVHFILASGIELFFVNSRLYEYRFTHHMLWGVPFDIQLAWAALWGAGLCIAWRSVHGGWKTVLVAAVIGATLAMDMAAEKTGLVFTPLAPLGWVWVCDVASLATLALSTIGFYIIVLEHRSLYLRAAVYGVAYAFIFYLLLPALILTFSRSANEIIAIGNPVNLTALLVCSIPGLIAAIQFAVNGDGSPLPLDPTRKLVTNGIYAYVRNPMQLSGLSAAIVWALATKSWLMWVYVFDMAVLLQLTKAFEDHEMSERFGDAFERYRKAVRLWIPRLSAYRE